MSAATQTLGDRSDGPTPTPRDGRAPLPGRADRRRRRLSLAECPSPVRPLRVLRVAFRPGGLRSLGAFFDPRPLEPDLPS